MEGKLVRILNKVNDTYEYGFVINDEYIECTSLLRICRDLESKLFALGDTVEILLNTK